MIAGSIGSRAAIVHAVHHSPDRSPDRERVASPTSYEKYQKFLEEQCGKRKTSLTVPEAADLPQRKLSASMEHLDKETSYEMARRFTFSNYDERRRLPKTPSQKEQVYKTNSATEASPRRCRRFSIEDSEVVSQGDKVYPETLDGSPDHWIGPPEKLYKVAVIGRKFAGKSALINQFMTCEYCSPFEPQDGTEETTFKSVSIKVEKHDATLHFMEFDADTTVFTNLLTEYDGLIFVYPATDQASFHKCCTVLSEIRQNALLNGKPAILAANKVDLARQIAVPAEEAQEVAKSLDCNFLEVSVALSLNINELLVGIFMKMRQARKALPTNPNAVAKEGVGSILKQIFHVGKQKQNNDPLKDLKAFQHV